MPKSSNSFQKKFLADQKRKKKKGKLEKIMQKRDVPAEKFENMIAYVDENGNLTDTPPEVKKEEPPKGY